MVKVYGYSDDLVIVEGPNPKEIECYRKQTKIFFEDGTIIKVQYPKRNIGVWEIELIEKGKAPFSLSVCNDENARIYSDVFTIDARIKDFTVEDKIG
jgi:hypothetical protein